MLLPLFIVTAVCTVSGEIIRPVVNTSLGIIIGKSVSFHDVSVNTFQSIPFAKPPTGDLRFKKPQPIEPWTEPIVAEDLPPGCVQYTSNPFPEADFMAGNREDCLFLNIWAPDTAGVEGNKAIMFWIYGGGYYIGSSRLDFYNGIALAALGDVIVVTSNYRLSTEGFLYSGTDDAPGNMGLYDILEALKWVHSNINYFGGDEKSITLFGHSAGAITSGMFLTSPLARGLFARVIMQSGAPTNLAAENNDHDFQLSQQVAEAVGCADNRNSLKNNPGKVVECLKGKDALQLVTAQSKISKAMHSLRGFYPRYGDALLPHNAREAILEGKFQGADILIGNVPNEGARILTNVYTDFFGFFGEKTSRINKTIGEFLIRQNLKSFPDPEIVVKHYLGNLGEYDEEKVLYQVQTALGDLMRLCPSVYMAESIAKKGSTALYYYFVHRPFPTPFAPWMGVVHFDETPFVFGYPLRYPSYYTESEQKLSTEMIEVWSSFAKYGPKPLLKKSWPQYSSRQHRYIVLDTDRDSIGIGPHLENCDFFPAVLWILRGETI